ncbi:MAG TPA: hypothetical protein VEK33_25120 [Terriglobales bacterium]|nr:hypothetical protein [Terriglobales bacterium]
MAVSVAARQLFAKLFALSEESETQVCQLPLRTRKRIGVSLYAEEVAAQLFYGTSGEETVFRARVLLPLLLPEDLTRARLRYATWRLVVRHSEAILELALDLSSPPQTSWRMTELEIYRIVPSTVQV